MTTQAPQLLLDLFQAYYDARKNKRKTKSALRFELNFEREIFKLYEDIISHRYEISPSSCFIIKKPVMREIFAGDFRDRVVHHLIFNYLNPLCERMFINDSYACRTGKGTSYGIRRADHFIRSVSENYTQECYVLKLDISGYFMSINKALLFAKVKNLVKLFESKTTFDTKLIMWIVEKIIFHDHIRGCIVKGRRKDWIGLPQSKSLFYAKSGCGLPIGNLTSQLFGNVYLNDFDHFASRFASGTSRGYYGRYVDDMLFVSAQKEALTSLVYEVRTYLKENLKLTLHPRKIYLQSYTKGVDFLGVSLRVGRMYPRHRMKGNIYRLVALWNTIVEENCERLDHHHISLFQASLNSYLGTIATYRTRRLRMKVLATLSLSLCRYVSFCSPYKKVALRKEDIRMKARPS